MKTFIKKLRHPKTDQLSVNIYKEDDKYYVGDGDGDWFDTIEECEAFEIDTLNQMYNGTYYPSPEEVYYAY